MKPLGKKNYGSIPHLSSSKLGPADRFIHEGQEAILTRKTRDAEDEILVFEKYDGSNVGIAKVNGKIVALTRSGYLASTSPYLQHHYFDKWVSERASIFGEIIDEGDRLVGEWLLQAHGVRYEINHVEPIVFFDYFRGSERVLYSDLLCKVHPAQQKILISTPRVISIGRPVEPKDLLDRLSLKDPVITRIDPAEGMVYRVERKGRVDFLAKWVRSDYEPGKYIIGVEEKDFIYNYDVTKLTL